MGNNVKLTVKRQIAGIIEKNGLGKKFYRVVKN
jgi:hypothetical protein